MKINGTKPWLFFTVLLVPCFTAILSSCGNVSYPNASPAASVILVNAVNGSAPQGLFINGTQYGGAGAAYGQSAGYYNVPSGSSRASFVDAGSVTANISFTANIGPGNYYSVYYATNDTTKTAVVIQNDRTLPSSGMAKVRFINLSSAVPAGVDFGISATSKLAAALAYKAVSTYNEVNANTTFYLYASGSVTSSLTIPTGVQAGKIYTIYVTGTTTLNLSFHTIAEN
jgi:hypothetical protein